LVAEIKKKSIETLKAEADSGNVEAQSALGLLYELGLEVSVNPKEAAKYWGMAAKSGNPTAQYSLAQVISSHFEDNDDNRSMVQALYKKAEEHGVLRPEKVLRLLERDKGNPIKILIVEDSTSVRLPLRRFLEAEGCDVIEAEDGLQGLNILKKDPSIKMVFSDLNMPIMNGLEMVAAIRLIDSLKKIPIVMLTTEGSNELVKRGKELKLKGWIVKPAKPHHLRKYLSMYT
jgi:two-component system, chemotaxis family, chemotaxis protein CheY